MRHVSATVNLDCELVHYDESGEKLQTLKRKYKTQAVINNPGLFGSVLVTSESKTVDVQSMLDEFEIERLDNYLVPKQAYPGTLLRANLAGPG